MTTLETLRRRNGWSQEHLAQLLEVNHSTVSYWESGRQRPGSPRTRRALERVFGKPVSELLAPAKEKASTSV